MKLNDNRQQRTQGLYVLGSIVTSLLKQGFFALAAFVCTIYSNFVRFIKPIAVSFNKRVCKLSSRILRRVRYYLSNQLKKVNTVKAHMKRVYSKDGYKKAIEFFIFGDRKHGYKKSPLAACCNYAAPAICAVLLFNIVAYAANIQYVVGVYFDDEVVAYVENQSVYDEAEGVLRSRLNYSESSDSYVELEPVFEVVKNENFELLDKNRLADILLTCTSNDVKQAYGVYSGTKFLGAVEDKASVETYISNALESAKNKIGGAEASLETEITYIEGLYLTTSVKPAEDMNKILSGSINAPVTYTVSENDSLDTVAAKLGIDAAKLNELNPDLSSKLTAGSSIIVNTVKPCVSIIVTKEETKTEEIPFAKETVKDDAKSVNSMPVVTRAGENGSKTVTYKKTYRNGVEIASEAVNAVITKEAVSEQTTVGTREVAAASTQTSDMYIWPLGGNGGYVSVALYGYSGHTGVDIAANAGTPIYAVADGVVIEAQTHNAYGKLIRIQHADGKQTYYAHCSYIGVTEGQQVKQGDFIGEVGMTGNATGNHLHIEVRDADGRTVLNPLDFLTR